MEYAYQSNKKKSKTKSDKLDDKQVYAAGKLYVRQATIEEAERYGIDLSKIM